MSLDETHAYNQRDLPSRLAFAASKEALVNLNAPLPIPEQISKDGRLAFFGLSLLELKEKIKSYGKEEFRAGQLFKWVYDKGEYDPLKMSNLSKNFRDELATKLDFSLPKMVSHRKSQLDGTQKFLFDMGDHDTVESVLIPGDDRLTLCISSEVGCNMACKFCFTAKQKLKKRLKAEQIVGQFLQAQKLATPGQRITNIVFMGMGEPLDNSDEVFKAIDIICSDFGINFSRRKITVSTSGIVPEMYKITQSRVRLAVSLNGVDDEMRSQIMPINKKYPLKELLAACLEHTQKSKDKVTFEHVLLKGITDSLDAARKLHQLTRRIPCKINIIPFNEHPESGYQRPSEEAIVNFQNELIRLGSHVLRRKTMGRDIFAACGQLNATFKNHPQTLSL